MDYMTKNDLALKGNFDGVELLIFPSNILLEKSQRKKLFYLFIFWVQYTQLFFIHFLFFLITYSCL